MKKWALVTMILFSAIAVTAQANDTLSESVKFGDLNVDSAAGAHALYMRIRAAALTVCERSKFSGDFLSQRVYESCLNSATNEAVAKIHSPALAALASPIPRAAVRVASR